MERELFKQGRGETEMPKAHPIIEALIYDSIRRLPPGHDARLDSLIIKGLIGRLQPYILESEDIQRQKETPEYAAYLKEHRQFSNGAEEGAVVCPDGRNDENYIMGPSEEVKIYRTLGGIPPTRLSTSHPRVPVLDSSELDANIKKAFSKKRAIKELVEYLQVHGISSQPENGCGYLKELTTKTGLTKKTAMKLGGIPTYMHKLDPSHITAFNNNAERAQGVGTTFLTFADHHSQGLVIMPYNIHQLLDPNKSLQTNFFDLQDQRKIVMSEKLDKIFHDQIIALAIEMGHPEAKLNTRDYTQLIKNVMLIGRIAREITLKQEKEGFPFIPKEILEEANATETAKRLVAHRIVRNSTERVLANRPNGMHPLMDHPEQFVLIDTGGGGSNSNNVPFKQIIPEGQISEDNLNKGIMLFDLLTETLEKRAITLEDEARVVVVAGRIEKERYTATAYDEKIKEESSQVANNTAAVRSRLEDGVNTGQVVVAGVIFDGKNKVISKAVTT